jgi:hypothetical protein
VHLLVPAYVTPSSSMFCHTESVRSEWRNVSTLLPVRLSSVVLVSAYVSVVLLGRFLLRARLQGVSCTCASSRSHGFPPALSVILMSFALYLAPVQLIPDTRPSHLLFPAPCAVAHQVQTLGCSGRRRRDSRRSCERCDQLWLCCCSTLGLLGQAQALQPLSLPRLPPSSRRPGLFAGSLCSAALLLRLELLLLLVVHPACPLRHNTIHNTVNTYNT